MSHLSHLGKDKKLQKIIATQEICILTKRKNVHLHLCNSIMSQQLSTKVADVFQKRFLALFKGKTPSAKQIAQIPIEKLQSIGLSNAKANYVHNVAQFFLKNNITDTQIHKLSNAELIKLLTQIKGVGQWTVEMILMFTIAREDVFAVDDLGIQQAMCKLYNINADDKKSMKEKMLTISKKWHPYQTYACRYLWGWKDAVPNSKK